MIKRLLAGLDKALPATTAHAHCDGPCGVYDPASARIAAEAVLSMTKKLLALEVPDPSDKAAVVKYHNTFARYVAIKEEQATIAKDEILVLWTDYFKPPHLEAHPELHDLIWKATKELSYAKVECSLEHAQNVMNYVQQIHELFWKTKNRDIAWYTAS
ncbi:MAG: superoxide dismutase, Ni [Myxococcota bacterium]|nr:superoxide dismutase, Ni [Myxococcota bacterium]